MSGHPTTQTPSILIVDDDEQIRNLFSEILKAENYSIQTAANTSEARNVLERNSIDVIVCDQVMDGEDGLTFLTDLCESHPALQRILVTGHSSEQNALRGINEAKLLRYLQKPCTPQDLLDTVQEALREAQRIQKLIKVESWPQRIVRFSKRAWQVTNIGILGLFALALTGILLLGLLYLLKWMLGIDLIPEFHLGDGL